MFGLIGKIFGSDSAIKKGASLIDNAFYTDQEKADNKARLLKLYEPFKLAQRVLAIAITTLFCLFAIVALCRLVFSVENEPLFELIEALGLDTLIAIIFGFYFGGGAIEGIVRGAKNEHRR